MQRTTKLKVFVGLELATDKGQYLCFFEEPRPRARARAAVGQQPREGLERRRVPAEAQAGLGAAIVAARPFDKDFSHPANDYVKTLKLLSAIEVYNPKARMGANELALEASESMKLPGVAGSDARTSLDEIGFAATLFKKPVNTQADLVKALLGSDDAPVQTARCRTWCWPGSEAGRAAAKEEEASLAALSAIRRGFVLVTSASLRMPRRWLQRRP